MSAAETNRYALNSTLTPLPHPPPPDPGALSLGSKVGDRPGAPEEPKIPERLGRFVIRRVLAVGGMGTVYEAEQDDPRRVVALKTLRQGITTDTTLRRFRVEAEILARLHHSSIAQIYEAGTLQEPGSVDQVPYFAMELVEGARPLDRYVADANLPIKQRVRTFLRVCDAVQYGHERGVIHRDLKPGNILVDSSGHPKLIDYGVAAARDRSASDLTLIADQGLLVGTLLYLSPEQLTAKCVTPDVRGDVYALGICLYEVLTDFQPFDLTEMSLADAVRRLVEDEPNAPRRVREDMPRELEWIILKALEKDPAHRYPSVQHLRDDLARFLDGKALEAAPRSAIYRARKFCTRHTAVVAFVLALILGLVATAAATWVGLARESALRETAEAEQRAAVRQSERAILVSQFFADLFANPNGAASAVGAVGDPASAQATDPDGARVTELFDRAARAMTTKKRTPQLKLELYRRLGRAATDAGLYEHAAAFEKKAQEIATALNGPRSPEAERARTAVEEAERRIEERRGRSP